MLADALHEIVDWFSVVLLVVDTASLIIKKGGVGKGGNKPAAHRPEEHLVPPRELLARSTGRALDSWAVLVCWLSLSPHWGGRWKKGGVGQCLKPQKNKRQLDLTATPVAGFWPSHLCVNYNGLGFRVATALRKATNCKKSHIEMKLDLARAVALHDLCLSK